MEDEEQLETDVEESDVADQDLLNAMKKAQERKLREMSALG